MTPVIVLFLLMLGAFYYSKRRTSNSYKPGARKHTMEPVSSSMLLSEVDPTKAAQVHIVSFIVFETKLKFADFRDRFVENVILSDPDSRFVYRLDTSGLVSPPVWIKANNWHPFDNCLCTTNPQTEETIKALLSERLTQPLDVTKPVWEMNFIDSFTPTKSGEAVSGVVLTMHHSMGDGFTLCHQIMRRAAPTEPGISMHECYPFKSKADARTGSSIRRFATTLVKIVKSIIKLLLLKPDRPSALRNITSRRMDDRIVCDVGLLPASVDRLKKIANKASLSLGSQLHGKVFLNDIVVTACSMALGDLMKERHDVTSAIWIGLNRKSVIERPKHRRFDWGNENLGTCYLQLPTGVKDPLLALLQCHVRLSEMKDSPEPIVANRLLSILGSVPLWILWPFRNLLMDKMSASISNFPGPVKQIKIPVAPDGAPNKHTEGIGAVKEAFFLVAPPFKYGPYVTILSYCGNMYLAISAAEKLMSQQTVSELVNVKVQEAIDKIDRALDSLIINNQT